MAEKRSIDVDLHWINDPMRNHAALNEVVRELEMAGWKFVSTAGPKYQFCRTVIDEAAFDKDVKWAERVVGKCLARGFPYNTTSGERVDAPHLSDDERMTLAAAYGIVGQWLVTLVEPSDA